MNIFSKIQPTKILHVIHRKADIQAGRIDLVDTSQFIQCAALKQPKGTTYKPHRHIRSLRSDYYIPQESWVVISGLVEVTLYDLDNSILHTDILCPGDVSITLEAGHNYKFLEDGIVYEYKTGPYYGQAQDKTFI